MTITIEKLIEFLRDNNVTEMEFDIDTVDYGIMLSLPLLQTEAIYNSVPHPILPYDFPVKIKIELQFTLGV